MSAIVRWEDPPEHGNTRRAKLKYADVADDLRRTVGQWAVIVEDIPASSAGALANRVRTGQGAFAPQGAFEARSVGPGRGKATVYARYVGEPS